MDDLIEFGKLLEALRPWQGRIVIIGGWAHRLYRFHPESNPPNYVPVTTKDADVAFSLKEPIPGDMGVALKSKGFEAQLMGEATPPVTHYHLGDEAGGFYAEFLVPLIGGRTTRSGELVPLTVETAGISAQKLRYLEILLVRPWSLEVDSSTGIEISNGMQVTIPNPVTFIAQKLFIKSKREANKQAQDALYIHDTIDLFANKLDDLNKIWIEEIRPTLPPKTATSIESQAREQFRQLNDIHRDAARIPQDRKLNPDYLQMACFSGL